MSNKWPWHLQYSTHVPASGETNSHTEPLEAANKKEALKEAKRIMKKKERQAKKGVWLYNAWIIYKEPLGEKTHPKSK